MTTRDPKPALDERITALLRSMQGPSRSDEAWDTQTTEILARLKADAGTDIEADLLEAPFPDELAASDTRRADPGAAAASRPRSLPPVRAEKPANRPSFTWLLASVVALA
ncbi:MAG TPA: hypothetical protein VK524_30305, partial [Polyangiaceae bacterium]|nr:hypothetical protein [Polyangiaceae bacterium]